MKFSKDYLLDRLGDLASTMYTEVTGTTRWGTTRREVFRHDGRFYATDYRVGSGDEGELPYAHEGDLVECQEVAAVLRQIIVWEPV